MEKEQNKDEEKEEDKKETLTSSQAVADVIPAGQSLTAGEEKGRVEEKDEEQEKEDERNKESQGKKEKEQNKQEKEKEDNQGSLAAEEVHDLEIVAQAGQSLTADEESLAEMIQYIHQRHVDPKIVSWHFTLNNHSSTRPDGYGGKVVESVGKCKATRRLAPGKWQCVISMPNSFLPGDGWGLEAVGEGKTEKEADEAACEAAIALLLLRNPSQVVLRPKHWTVPIDELVRDLPAPSVGAGDMRQALPVHVRTKSEHAGDVGAAMTPEDRDSAVEKVLSDILIAHGGTFNPAHIQHWRLVEQGLAPSGARKAYETLDRLLPPAGLRPFIQRRSAFVYKDVDGGMEISWSPGHAPAFGSAAPEEQHKKEVGDIDLR